MKTLRAALCLLLAVLLLGLPFTPAAVAADGGFRWGDVNFDGTINSGDTLLYVKFLNGMITPTAPQRFAADTDGDGSLTEADKDLVLSYQRGERSSFPVEADYLGAGLLSDKALVWSLDLQGNMAIAGTGATPDLSSDTAWPWHALRPKIRTLTVAPGVTRIGSDAFRGCDNLRTVSLPEGLTGIGSLAFYSCVSLNSIVIPASVTEIGVSAFSFLNSLGAFQLAGGSESFSVRDGVLFDRDGTTLLAYPGGKSGAYTVPDGVTAIGTYAFLGSLNLTSVKVSNSVTSIGFMAFACCYRLSRATLSDSVSYLASGVFNYCTELYEVRFGSGLSRIDGPLFGSVTTLGLLSYRGTRADWGRVEKRNGAAAELDALEIRWLTEPGFRFWEDALTIEDSLEGFGHPEGYETPYEVWAFLYGDCEETRSLYDLHRGAWAGCPSGMAGAALLFYDGTTATVGQFGRASASDLRCDDSDGLCSLADMMDAIQTLQYFESFRAQVRNSEPGIRELFRQDLPQDRPVLVQISSGTSYHTLLAYYYEQTGDAGARIAVYDPLWPGQERWLDLTLSNGSITGWSYDFGFNGMVWSQSAGQHLYAAPGSALTELWAERGHILAEETVYYTVTFDPNGGTVSETSRQVEQGKPIGALPTPTRTGYTFLGWYTASSGGIQVDASWTTAGDRTLYAHWSANSYTVTLDANGGDYDTTKTVLVGEPYGVLGTPARTGYSFTGWYTQAAGGSLVSASTTVTATEDHRLYAHWTANTYTLTLDPNGGSLTGQTTRTVTYDAPYGVLPTPTRSGYRFEGWADAPEGGQTVTAESLVRTARDHTLYALWRAEQGFTASVNAWRFGNSAAAFGYTGVGPGSSYPIRYTSVATLFGRNIFADNVLRHLRQQTWNGNCFGMASTSALFWAENDLDPEDFGGETVYSLELDSVDPAIRADGGKNQTVDLTAKVFIEAMQVAQYTELFAETNRRNRADNAVLQNGGNLNALVLTVREDSRSRLGVVLTVSKGAAGHALLATGIEESGSGAILFIYDCNYPGQDRTMTLTKNASGDYTRWEYEIGGPYGVWGSTAADCAISYAPLSLFQEIWDSRTNTDKLRPKLEALSTSAGNFDILDFRDDVVAEVRGGVLRYTADPKILQAPSLDRDNTATELLFLPVDDYTIVSQEAAGTAISCSLFTDSASASVSTTAESIGVTLVDGSGGSSVSIPYVGVGVESTIELVSGSDGAENTLYVSCTGNDDSLNVSRAGDNAPSISGYGALLDLSIDGENTNVSTLHTIHAEAGEGGSIWPAGDVRVAYRADQSFSFCPDPGWTVKAVYVNGVSVGAASAYTFERVESEQSLRVEFRQIKAKLTAAARSGAKLSVDYTLDADALLTAAVYAADGRLVCLVSAPVAANSAKASLTLPRSPGAGEMVRVFLTDGRSTPLCAHKTA